MKSAASQSQMQGEGDYESAKEYNRQTREFIKSGKVEDAARAAAPRSASEAEEMKKAEAEGRAHARADGNTGGADAALQQKRSKPAGDTFTGY